jgi:hypothetical protein
MALACGVIQEDAAFLASLRSDDVTRVAAYVHAASCDRCAAALAEGATVIAWIDAALAEPASARSEASPTSHAQSA